MAEIVILGASQLQARLTAVQGSGPAVMAKLAARTLAEMKQRIARKTSTTSRTLHASTVSPVHIEIQGAQNALWIDKGTRPHRIPKAGNKLLAWPAKAAGRRLSGRARVSTRRGKNGGMAFAMHVQHPGTKAQPYISTSVRTAIARSGLAETVTERWDKGA